MKNKIANNAVNQTKYKSQLKRNKLLRGGLNNKIRMTINKKRVLVKRKNKS